MGLNDNVRSISSTLISERKEAKKSKQQKEYLQELKDRFNDMLFNELIKKLKENCNIYKNEIHDILIDYIITEHQNTLNSIQLKRFNNLYINDIYTNLQKNYFTLCAKAEKVYKMQEAEKEDYKKIIAFEKLQLDKEKFQHKKNIDYAKINNTNYKNNNINYVKIILIIFKICCIIAFTPILLTILFLYGLICGLAKMMN